MPVIRTISKVAKQALFSTPGCGCQPLTVAVRNISFSPRQVTSDASFHSVSFSETDHPKVLITGKSILNALEPLFQPWSLTTRKPPMAVCVLQTFQMSKFSKQKWRQSPWKTSNLFIRCWFKRYDLTPFCVSLIQEDLVSLGWDSPNCWGKISNSLSQETKQFNSSWRSVFWRCGWESVTLKMYNAGFPFHRKRFGKYNVILSDIRKPPSSVFHSGKSHDDTSLLGCLSCLKMANYNFQYIFSTSRINVFV